MSTETPEPGAVEVMGPDEPVAEAKTTTLAVVDFGEFSKLAIAKLGKEVEGLKVDDDDPDSFTAFKKQYTRVQKARTGIDKIRKALVQPAMDYKKKVDAAAKELKALIEPIEAPLLAEKKRHEAVLAERKKEVEKRIQNIRNYASAQYENATAIGEAARTLDAHEIDPRLYGGMMDEAEQAKTDTLATLDSMYKEAVAREEFARKQAELEKRERELAEREAKMKAEQEAKERAEREAKEKAERERAAEIDRSASPVVGGALAADPPADDPHTCDSQSEGYPSPAPDPAKDVPTSPGEPSIPVATIPGAVIDAANTLGNYLKAQTDDPGNPFEIEIGPVVVRLRGGA